MGFLGFHRKKRTVIVERPVYIYQQQVCNLNK